MLNGKIALITGASSGIGTATIRRFLKEGATVVGVGNKTAEIDNIQGNFSFIECDVTEEAQIAAACKQVAEKYGKLNVLVTICDKMYQGNMLNIDQAVFEKASKHIVMAPMLFVKYCNDMLRNAEYGAIIHNIPTSALLIREDAMASMLNTSIINYLRQSSIYLRPVRTVACVFGLIDGHLMSDAEREFYMSPKGISAIPARRLGTPEDVANLNTFIASDKGAYLNSSILEVDGGLFTTNPSAMGSAI